MVNAHLDSLHQQAQQTPREFIDKHGIDFCSNDYLSLAGHPVIKARVKSFFVDDNNALCSTGSRFVSGHYQQLKNLEENFAAFAHRDSALFFSNGYIANIAVLATLARGCTVFSDELNHASLIDGIRVAGTHRKIYRHNDLDDLETLLKQPSASQKAIVTESIFSTNGTMIDIDAFAALAQKYDALLFVDEAHATGIFGHNGGGLVSTLKECRDNIITMHSCGKALASFGAFVAASEKIISIIKNCSRQFICTTAPPPYQTAHVLAVMDFLQRDSERHARLMANMSHRQLSVPIVAVIVDENQRALFIRDQLRTRGFSIAAFRFPSVTQAQLRVTLHSDNTIDDIDKLFAAIDELS